MPAAILAADTGGIVGAAIVAALSLGAVVLVDRFFRARGSKVARVLGGGELSPVADTRLRFLRRLFEAAILVIGASLAVSQFTELHHLASTVLASSAIVAAVVGFASRQVLANAIAGVVIAVTQPLRIGDLVTFEDQTGTVEDITLAYTWLRTGSDARLVVPNERLATGVLRNDSIRSPTVALEVVVWLHPAADEEAAVAAILECDGVQDVRVADIAETGAVKVVVAGPPDRPADRLRREGELRVAVLGALRDAGVPRAGMETA